MIFCRQKRCKALEQTLHHLVVILRRFILREVQAAAISTSKSVSLYRSLLTSLLNFLLRLLHGSAINVDILRSIVLLFPIHLAYCSPPKCVAIYVRFDFNTLLKIQPIIWTHLFSAVSTTSKRILSNSFSSSSLFSCGTSFKSFLTNTVNLLI